MSMSNIEYNNLLILSRILGLDFIFILYLVFLIMKSECFIFLKFPISKSYNKLSNANTFLLLLSNVKNG